MLAGEPEVYGQAETFAMLDQLQWAEFDNTAERGGFWTCHDDYHTQDNVLSNDDVKIELTPSEVIVSYVTWITHLRGSQPIKGNWGEFSGIQ